MWAALHIRHFLFVEAVKCDQSVLGIIGDFIIRVDVVFLTITYTETGNGYQISLRSCHEKFPANVIVNYLCKEIGNGGGHQKKAGGQIQKERMQTKYGKKPIFEVLNDLLCQYVEENNIKF